MALLRVVLAVLGFVALTYFAAQKTPGLLRLPPPICDLLRAWTARGWRLSLASVSPIVRNHGPVFVTCPKSCAVIPR